MKINIDIGQTFLSVFSFFIILIISIPLVYLVVRVLGSDGNLLELIFRRRILLKHMTQKQQRDQYNGKIRKTSHTKTAESW